MTNKTFQSEAEKANDVTNKQSDKDRIESGERNPAADAERQNRNIPQAKPDVTLSRTNETEEEAEERGAKAKARGGVNNEPGMDRPVPASTPQKNDLDDAQRRARNSPDGVEPIVEGDDRNSDGTAKAMQAKSDDEVTCRITKKGDGQVFKGGLDATGTYAKGENITLDRKIADDLEDRGFVEIED